MPDHTKPLHENLADLSTMLRAWAVVLVDTLQTLPDDRKLLRASLRAIAGALHYYANEASNAAREAR